MAAEINRPLFQKQYYVYTCGKGFRLIYIGCFYFFFIFIMVTLISIILEFFTLIIAILLSIPVIVFFIMLLIILWPIGSIKISLDENKIEFVELDSRILFDKPRTFSYDEIKSIEINMKEKVIYFNTCREHDSGLDISGLQNDELEELSKIMRQKKVKQKRIDT